MVTFDNNTPDAIYLSALETSTYEVVDTGTTGTISIEAPSMDVRYENGSASEETGPVELIAECAAPFRYE